MRHDCCILFAFCANRLQQPCRCWQNAKTGDTSRADYYKFTGTIVVTCSPCVQTGCSNRAGDNDSKMEKRTTRTARLLRFVCLVCKQVAATVQVAKRQRQPGKQRRGRQAVRTVSDSWPPCISFITPTRVQNWPR